MWPDGLRADRAVIVSAAVPDAVPFIEHMQELYATIEHERRWTAWHMRAEFRDGWRGGYTAGWNAALRMVEEQQARLCRPVVESTMRAYSAEDRRAKYRADQARRGQVAA